MKKLSSCIIISTFFLVSCGKETEENKSYLTAERKSAKDKFSEIMNDFNEKIDERVDSVGKGFNSITGLTADRCLENENSKFIFEPNSRVSYEENLNSDQLQNKLGIGINATIPVQASGVPITLSPEMRYSIESSSSGLSRTANMTIEIIRGYNSLSASQNKYFKLKEEQYKNLKENKAEFFNSCGDEIIIKQKIKAQLLITAKFNFSDSKTKSEFEAAMGASIPVPFNLGGNQAPASVPSPTNPTTPVLPSSPSNNPSLNEAEYVNSRIRIAEPSSNTFNEDLSVSSNRALNSFETNSRRIEVGTKKNLNATIDLLKDQLLSSNGDNKVNPEAGMSPQIKVKFNNLSEETIRNISISIKAIQLGGDPTKLPTLLSATCKLSDPGACDSLFSSIQKYAAVDFPEQLKELPEVSAEKTNNKYYLADTEKSLYGNFTILSPTGLNISKDIIKYTDKSILFSNFKLLVRKDLRKNFQNYIRSQDIENSKSFKNLATDEIQLVKSTKETSENNLYTTYRFLNSCFNDIKLCQHEYMERKKDFILDQDILFDDIKPWTLISSTDAKWQPVRTFLFFGINTSDRISSDFFYGTDLRGYTTFMIKYLDKNKNKITAKNYPGKDLSISFRCETWWFDIGGKAWMRGVHPNNNYPISDHLINLCEKKKISSASQNSDLKDLDSFQIELWAE